MNTGSPAPSAAHPGGAGAPVAESPRWSRLAALVVAVAVLAGVAFALLAPIRWLSYRATDDSYYYFQVARNVVLGHGVSFDGMHPTNGFHPLWMLCLLPVYALAGGAPELGHRLVYVLVFLLAGASIAVAHRAFEAGAGRRAAAIGALVMLTPPVLNPMLNGLETGVLMLVSFLVLWLVPRHRLLEVGGPVRRDVALGVLLGALVLARLDTALLAACVLAVPVVRALAGGEGASRPAAALAKALRAGLVTALVVAPYFAWNFASFGHFMPISGGIKTDYTKLAFSLERFMIRDTLYGVGLLGASLAALAWFAARRRTGRTVPIADGALPLLAAIGAGCAIHLANTLLFMSFGVYWWHYASYVPLALMLGTAAFAVLLSRAPRPAEVAGGAAVLVLIGAAGGFAVDFRMRAADHERWYRAALWAREQLPKGAVVAMTDCGVFGYFSDRPTVNLDGVINGYEFQRALRDGQLSRYLAAAGVTHIASSSVFYEGDVFRVWLPARLYRAQGGLIVGRREAEVYRDEEPDRALVVIWDLRRSVVCDVPGDPETYRRAMMSAGAPPEIWR